MTGRAPTQAASKERVGAGRGAGAQAVAAAPGHAVQRLQQSLGNRGLEQALGTGGVGSRLAISRPDDPAEREADRLAGEIVARPAAPLAPFRPSPAAPATIYRQAAGPFTVSDLYAHRADEPDFVFFDWAEPEATLAAPEDALDADEREKIRDQVQAMAAASPATTTITLYGYASEEGGWDANRALIDRRLAAVRNVLRAEGFTGTIRLVRRQAAASGQVDYRFWRAVEMRPGGGASTRVGGTGSATVACGATRTATMDAARVSALGLLDGQDGALARLDRYLADPTGEPDVATALDNNFDGDHSPATARAVRHRLASIRAFLAGMAPLARCATEDEATCRAGAAASADPSIVILCPNFFDDPGLAALRDEILLHEAGHGSGFQVRDRAYRGERVILFLNTAQALDNAESLSIFALELAGRRPPVVGRATPDTVTGCGADERTAREAIAWAERWNTYAMFGAAQTYDNPGTMAYWIQLRFGRSDRAARAGLHDRYRLMDEVFQRQLAIACLPATDPACTAGTRARWTLPDRVDFCPGFFTSLPALDDRVRRVYAALAIHQPGVTPPQDEAYPLLARDYMVRYWRVT